MRDAGDIPSRGQQPRCVSGSDESLYASCGSQGGHDGQTVRRIDFDARSEPVSLYGCPLPLRLLLLTRSCPLLWSWKLSTKAANGWDDDSHQIIIAAPTAASADYATLPQVFRSTTAEWLRQLIPSRETLSPWRGTKRPSQIWLALSVIMLGMVKPVRRKERLLQLNVVLRVVAGVATALPLFYCSS
nr:hypothetical protein CFP56_13092 [Quercus suber]